jgi:hypothetical protein
LKPLRGRLDRASESIARRGLAGIGKQPHLTIITPDLTDEEIAALTHLLREKIDNDRYPLSPRIQVLKGILAKIRPEPAREPSPHRRERVRRAGAATGAKHLKSTPAPPMTLGNAARAGVRLIVWCKKCHRQVESDPAEQAHWYGAEMPVPQWQLCCENLPGEGRLRVESGSSIGASRPPLPHYSITSSARARIAGGTVRPSAVAVLRLTTSSKVVGCSTGRSAGFAPFRILSTKTARRL